MADQYYGKTSVSGGISKFFCSVFQIWSHTLLLASSALHVKLWVWSRLAISLYTPDSISDRVVKASCNVQCLVLLKVRVAEVCGEKTTRVHCSSVDPPADAGSRQRSTTKVVFCNFSHTIPMFVFKIFWGKLFSGI